MICAVIVAAGEGRRYGERKQFAPLGGKQVVRYALDPFLEHESVDSIVLVLPAGGSVEGEVSFMLPEDPRLHTVAGGERRQESVFNGLSSLPEGCRTVIIHDGARPLLSGRLLDALIHEAGDDAAVVPGIPVSDTVKEVEDGNVIRTVDRTRLLAIQTPQIFPYRLIREAHERARSEGRSSTDDAQLVEAIGAEVRVIPGDPDNIKVTTPRDLRVAELILDGRRDGP